MRRKCGTSNVVLLAPKLTPISQVSDALLKLQKVEQGDVPYAGFLSDLSKSYPGRQSEDRSDS